jgi:hypothetical protein
MYLMWTVQYTWQDYKTKEDIFSELKINPVVKNIQNYRMDIRCSAKGQSQTATHNYSVSAMWEKKPRTNPQNTSRLLMVPEHITRPKTLQAIWWRWWSLVYLRVTHSPVLNEKGRGWRNSWASRMLCKDHVLSVRYKPRLNKQLSIKLIIQSNTTRLHNFDRLFVCSKNKLPIKRPWNSTWILRSTFIWRESG